MIRTLIGAMAGAALALSGTASAHHSFSAEFDPESSGELSGTITRVWFTNPHVRYRLDVTAEDGSTQEWELQMSSVTTLRAANWGQDTVKVGDRVTATGQLGRNGAQKLYLRNLVTESGADLSVYRSREQAVDPQELAKTRTAADYGYGKLNVDAPFDITGAWRNSYKFRVTVDDLEPKPTPFTPQARDIYEATEHYDDYSLRCLAPGLPRIFGSPYNMEILDAGSHYVVVQVEHNMPRRIYMDGRTPPPGTPPTSLGYSVGHWEDDVLVIETTHLLPAWLDGSGLPMSGEGTRIVERWEFGDDRLAMDRIMTIHDPYYTAPLVRRRGSARGDDVEVIEQASCDPDGYFRDLFESGRLEQYLSR